MATPEKALFQRMVRGLFEIIFPIGLYSVRWINFVVFVVVLKVVGSGLIYLCRPEKKRLSAVC